MGEQTFEQLIGGAERQAFEGWDFSHLEGRLVEAPSTLDYVGVVRSRLHGVTALLDLGTGGGEVLSEFAPLPPTAVATEAYEPNAYLAARRLAALGACVALVEGAPENWETIPDPERDRPALPFRDAVFDLVINRHESYLPAEVFRVLRPGGRFLTQQCGGTHHAELNDLMGAPRPRYTAWSLAAAEAQLRGVGFANVGGREEVSVTEIHDVGAIVYYLRAVPWQIEGFRAADYTDRLRGLHERMVAEGPLHVHGRHFIVEGLKPA